MWTSLLSPPLCRSLSLIFFGLGRGRWRAQLLIGYEKGLLLLWDVMTKGVLVQFDTSPASVPKCMTWLPDNSMFKTGHDDGKVECWSIKSPTALESKDEDTFEFCEPVTNISAYQNSGTTMLVHDGGKFSLSSVTPDYRSPTHHNLTCIQMRQLVGSDFHVPKI